MYARSNTLHGKPEMMDQGMAYVRDEVMPMVLGMEGCVGLSMLGDRDSGRCIVTTSWESEDAMHASESGVHSSRSRAGEIIGATAEVAEWAIAMMHRSRESMPGARVRVIWSGTDPGRMDDTVDAFRATMLPRIEDLPGFCSLSMLTNRDMDRTVLAVTYADAASMAAADDAAAAMRAEAGREMGMRISEVAQFDLLLAHLRVPETV